jgi:membrane dipeptidase
MRRIIDGHLDLAWNALSWDRDITESLDAVNDREAGMTDHPARRRATTTLPEMRRGGIVACQATLLVRAKPSLRRPEGHSRMSLDHPSQHMAHAVAQGQLAYYCLLERLGHVRILTTSEDLDEHWRTWSAASSPLGIILAMEGADPIVEPEHAQSWWDDGLRSVNLAHYGRSRYAVGTGDDGPITEAGLALLREFERLGMILDATHLSDTSFYQALDHFGGPVLASHNNCRALVPNGRQFSDDQIQRLIARDAVIGAALDAWMLAPGWIIGQTQRDVVSLASVADHIDHVCQLAGSVRHAAIGSDLDGGFGTEQTPTGLDTIADLERLSEILATRGYSDADIDAVFHGNWLRFFRENLPSRIAAT